MSAQNPNDGMVVWEHDSPWEHLVLIFLEDNPTRVLAAASRDVLGVLVADYWALTSVNANMRSLLLELDRAYGLEGLGMIEGDVLFSNRIANTRHMMAQQQAPLPPQPAHTMETATYPDPTTFHLTMPPAPAPAPTLPPPPPPPQPGLQRCFPPDLEHKITINNRDKAWNFACDSCNHQINCQNDTNRHIRVGALRPGFRIVAANPFEDRHWYGLDAAGNEFMGDIIRTNGQPMARSRIRRPCGPRITAEAARQRARRQTGRNANIRTQGEDERGAEDEDEDKDEEEE